MTSSRLVNATDLESWAKRRSTQEQMPRVLRRLIHATVERVLRIDLPADEGVQLGGWDGIVSVEKGNAFVPDGISAWEMSVGDPKKKADENYKKRTQNPLAIERETSTFVFVTPQRWGGKDGWIATKRRESKWRDVRVLDAGNLEDWLESAPAVHIWLSILLGKHPEDATDLERFWLNWSEATRPATSPALVLAGRDGIAKRIQTWFAEPQLPLSIQAESPDEALAIFAAVLHQLPLEERTPHLSRALVVRSLPAWNHLTASEERLLLIPLFDSSEIVASAIRRGHGVIVPLGRSDSVSDETLVAPRLSREKAVDALASEGIDRDKAQRLAALARHSLTSFRRKLALLPSMHQPAWSLPAEAEALLPAMLAGTWNGAKEGDRQALAKLAGASYSEVARVLVRWSNESDPPVRCIGDVWTITSKEDALSLLGKCLTRDLLLRFEDIALQVLGTPDPRYDLPKDKRPFARAFKMIPEWSDELYKGIADTLAALGARGGKISISSGGSAADIASRIIRKILDKANADWRIWASLSDARVLPFLAEAAPSELLAAVDAGLSGENPLLSKLFGEPGGVWWCSSSQLSSLLWALETLAWSPDYLAHAASLLAKLARLDPGGKHGKRPQSSLREIFLLWYPQTAADLEQRLRVLDVLREREPKVSWQLLLQLLPDVGGWAIVPPGHRWREWRPDSSRGVTREECIRGSREVANRIVTDVDQGASRWLDVIPLLAKFPKEAQSLVLQPLATLDLETLHPSDRSKTWDALRSLIALHRRHPGAPWALSGEILGQLDSIYSRFEPDETLLRSAWLFTNRPEMPEGSSWEAQREAMEQGRLAAVRVTLDEAGLTGLLELARCVECPDHLGSSLGRSEFLEDEEDALLCQHLTAEEPFRAKFARGFTCGRSWSRGREWGEQKLAGIGRAWTPAQQAELLICLVADLRTMDLVESMGQETEREYWRQAYPQGLKEPAEVERAIRKLLEQGQPFTACQFLADNAARKRVPAMLIFDVLERLLQPQSYDDPPRNSGRDAALVLFDLLEATAEVDENRLIDIEFALLPLLAREVRTPRLLHRKLGEDPEFFAEAVSWVHLDEVGVANVTEGDASLAESGLALLNSWQTVPGINGERRIDADVLKNWVRRAQEAAAERRCRRGGDNAIGRLLSNSPTGLDGLWPHEAVRDVIEESDSSELERAFELETIYVRRGVVSKAFDEGGEQERELVVRYTGFAAGLCDRWPKTAAMLRRIAESYGSAAHREDCEADLREDDL